MIDHTVAERLIVECTITLARVKGLINSLLEVMENHCRNWHKYSTIALAEASLQKIERDLRAMGEDVDLMEEIQTHMEDI